MKRPFLFPVLLLCILLLPNFTASQDSSARDSSAANKKSRRAFVRQQEWTKDHALLVSEQAHLFAEQARMQAETAQLSAQLHSELAPHLYELQAQALAQVGPAIEQAMELTGPAIEQAMELVGPAIEQATQELQNVDWPEINAAMQEASRKMARLGPLPHIPPIPPMPPLPAMAPLPAMPPIPPIPPIPNGPLPMFFHESFGWDWQTEAYAKNLTDDEQVHLQALAALLDRDETTALPELKRLAREHANWAMRASTVAMLAHAESSNVLPILDEALNKDTDQRVRLAAVRALAIGMNRRRGKF
jgi:hypothetical protein